MTATPNVEVPNVQMLTVGQLLTPSQLLSPAWLRIEDGLISALGAGSPPGAVDRNLGDTCTVIPGMVDMHTHGGGGFDMTNNDPGQIRAALRWSLRRGVTASVLSTVAAPLADLEAAISLAAAVQTEQRSARATGPGGTSPAETRLLGVHLEGPFLSTVRRGAHRASNLLLPSAAAVRRLLDAAPGAVAMVTLAPELDGALAAITAIRDAGAVAAVGHTDADAAQTDAAVRAGATVATHLFNGMRGLHHREPGPPGALLVADGVTCELICDGQHLHRTVIALAHRAAGTGRIALITDGVAATGAPDGRYRIGSVDVLHRDGAVRVEDAAAPGGLGSLGGGGVGLDEALRRAIAVVGLPLQAAVQAVTSTPARALGVGDLVGALAPGRVADLCVLDGDLRLRGVCRAGAWLDLTRPDAAPVPAASA